LSELYLEDAPSEKLRGDGVTVYNATNFKHIDLICVKPLDLTPTSSALLPTTPSYLIALHDCLSDITGYHTSFYPYHAHIE